MRARYVDVSAAFAGHGLSDRQAPWVNGVVLASLGSLVPDSSSFHLTAEGSQAYATPSPLPPDPHHHARER